MQTRVQLDAPRVRGLISCDLWGVWVYFAYDYLLTLLLTARQVMEVGL
jgi:hypothetical protein